MKWANLKHICDSYANIHDIWPKAKTSKSMNGPLHSVKLLYTSPCRRTEYTRLLRHHIISCYYYYRSCFSKRQPIYSMMCCIPCKFKPCYCNGTGHEYSVIRRPVSISTIRNIDRPNMTGYSTEAYIFAKGNRKIYFVFKVRVQLNSTNQIVCVLQ